MKTMKILMVAATLLVAGTIFYSCQKETMQPVKEQGVMVVKNGETLQTYYFTKSDNTVGKLTYYDPMCIGTQTKLTFSEFENGSNIKVDYFNTTINDWVEVETGKRDAPYVTYVNAPNVGTFLFRARVGNSGFTVFNVSAISCCVTELKGRAISCGTSREAEFTFTYLGEIDYVKIQGGLTNFTGADAVVTVPTGYTVNQWTPGGSSNRVISVEGPASCTPLVINITWNSTNTGDVITGEWTAVDTDGNLLGLAVAGLECAVE